MATPAMSHRRYKDDVQLMQSLGLKGYRFSINWARVLPEGTGRINRKGLDFYSRLVDELLEHGIVPNATLFHWDLPAALDDRGGWLNRDSAHWFAEYAAVMFKALDDRVPRWTTLNEPWVVTDGGYLHGVLAPGHRNRFEAPIAAHQWLGVLRPAGRRRRQRGRPAALHLSAQAPARAASRDRGRREREGLLRLVAAGQPGVVAGFFQALRAVPRRLCHPATHAQGQREAV